MPNLPTSPPTQELPSLPAQEAQPGGDNWTGPVCVDFLLLFSRIL